MPRLTRVAYTLYYTATVASYGERVVSQYGKKAALEKREEKRNKGSEDSTSCE